MGQCQRAGRHYNTIFSRDAEGDCVRDEFRWKDEALRPGLWGCVSVIQIFADVAADDRADNGHPVPHGALKQHDPGDDSHPDGDDLPGGHG